jgi:hypothetical protein
VAEVPIRWVIILQRFLPLRKCWAFKFEVRIEYNSKINKNRNFKRQIGIRVTEINKRTDRVQVFIFL